MCQRLKNSLPGLRHFARRADQQRALIGRRDFAPNSALERQYSELALGGGGEGENGGPEEGAKHAR